MMKEKIWAKKLLGSKNRPREKLHQGEQRDLASPRVMKAQTKVTGKKHQIKMMKFQRGLKR